MADFSTEYLAGLATPEIIETLDAEAILATRKAELVSLAPSYGFNYDVTSLETEPGVILLEEASYEEVNLRARGNDIARARYLYFARGTEVDHLGAFHDCVRMVGEDDTRFKLRIILAIQGRSTGGTAPRYRGAALAASLRVADAEVYTVGRSPQINVAVFAADNNGVADEPLLALVRAALADPAFRMVNDTIVVRAAVTQVVPVSARIWLTPETSEDLIATMQAELPAKWAAIAGLGRDLTTSWLIEALMQPGVHRVEITAPATDIIVLPYTTARIGTVSLTFAGRDF